MMSSRGAHAVPDRPSLGCAAATRACMAINAVRAARCTTAPRVAHATTRMGAGMAAAAGMAAGLAAGWRRHRAFFGNS